MKITYIEHSGFAVEHRDVVFIFDYFKGELPDFGKDRKLYVFASHAHYDHFQRSIFTWASRYPDITYILSDDITAKGPDSKVIHVGADKEIEVDGIRIKTLCSTDEGVAFLICMEDKTIYHAGDLNWWHWKEESPVYNQYMKKRYKRSIAKIENVRIDAAFIPLDPRLEEQYYWGIDWFMKHTDTKHAFPMHMQGRYDLYEKLMDEPDARGYKDKVINITKAGQTFIIEDGEE